MLFNSAVFAILTLLSIMLEVDCFRVIQRESDKEVKPRRDYRPNKWLANSAMDVWYGNKTFIDIVWREFSDLMYKLTDRDDRSITFNEYEAGEVQDTTAHPFADEIIKLDVRLSNNTNETTYTLYFDHPSNSTVFKTINETYKELEVAVL